jgi:sortase (surface protein transpeptidase)
MYAPARALISVSGWSRMSAWLMAAVLALMLGAAPAVAQEEQPLALGSIPASIDIPRIGTHAPIVPLGLEDDGAMAAPADPDTVGWWQDGPGLGGPGNMLLDGHVDWAGRLRVFGLLRQLQPGDLIQVTDTDGVSKSYSVVWTRLYDAETAPLDEIFPTTFDEQLTLITCGGDFDPAVRMYVSRWVVRAEPISAD